MPLPSLRRPALHCPALPRRRARAVVLAVVVGVSALLGGTPATAISDDYPYRLDTTGTADRWGFTKRQCVSFVAWRTEQRGQSLDNGTQGWGSALTWDDAALRLGFGVGSRPVPGSIAHWDAGEQSALYSRGSGSPNASTTAGPLGHVGYVRAVHGDGSASIEHYNGQGDRKFAVSRVRAPRYLYVGVSPPA